MPETQGGYTKYFPKDKGTFAEGGDAWCCLNAGLEIVLNENGWIIDVWDPEAKVSWKSGGDCLFGTAPTPRDTSFVMPDLFKDPKDMTADELENNIKLLKIDYSSECRTIRMMQRRLKFKNKRMGALSAQLYLLSRRAAGHSGYVRRVWKAVTTGSVSGYGPVSDRSYSRRHSRVVAGVKRYLAMYQ